MIGDKYNHGSGVLKDFLSHPSPQDELTRILPLKLLRNNFNQDIRNPFTDGFGSNSDIPENCGGL